MNLGENSSVNHTKWSQNSCSFLSRFSVWLNGSALSTINIRLANSLSKGQRNLPARRHHHEICSSLTFTMITMTLNFFLNKSWDWRDGSLVKIVLFLQRTWAGPSIHVGHIITASNSASLLASSDPHAQPHPTLPHTYTQNYMWNKLFLNFLMICFLFISGLSFKSQRE